MDHWWALWAERIARLLADRWRRERAGTEPGAPAVGTNDSTDATDTSVPPESRTGRDSGGTRTGGT